MNSIQFHYVIPHVFASREEQHSDIWQQDVRFEKEKLYLVEAESGKGKSTFCSYIQGYRHDYMRLLKDTLTSTLRYTLTEDLTQRSTTVHLT